MAFQLAWRTWFMVLTVSTWPESGFREGVARLRGQGLAGAGVDGNGRVVDGVDVVGDADGAGHAGRCGGARGARVTLALGGALPGGLRQTRARARAGHRDGNSGLTESRREKTE